LNCKAEARVISAQLIDETAVAIVEMEVLG
jgi:hypothetical protein